MPAPAMTTIFFFFRSTDSRRSNWASLSSSRLSRSTYLVVRVLLMAILRLFAGGGPSVLTQISSLAFGSFIGDALPEGIALELGEGYLFAASDSIRKIGRGDGGREGDLDRTDSGEDGDEGGEEPWLEFGSIFQFLQLAG